MKHLAAAALLAAAVAMLPLPAKAKPVFQASQGNVVLMLHTEECAFQGTVALPLKATWTQDGKTVEGCWGPRADLKVVLFYFPSDKSVFAVGMDHFTKLTEA